MKKIKILLIVILLNLVIFNPITNVGAFLNNDLTFTVKYPDNKTKTYDNSKGSFAYYIYNDKSFVRPYFETYVSGIKDETLNVRSGETDKIKFTFDEQYVYTAYIEVMGVHGDETEFVIEDFNNYTLNLSQLFDHDQISFIDNKGSSAHDFMMDRSHSKIVVDFYFSKESKLAISGEDSLVNNIDKPYTLDQIKKAAKITAFDSHDGDITHLIKVVSDEYSTNKNKVGNFKITYEVTNKGNLKTTYVLTIINTDFTSPVITGPTTKKVSYSAKYTLQIILALFSVKDNYDLNPTLEIKKHNFVENKIGTFTIDIIAKDKTGNISEFKFTLEVIDDMKPIIKDENNGKLQINFKTEITNQLLVQGLTAEDHIDGDLTKSIKVVSNDIKPILGNYIVKYEVKDKAGNIATHERSFEVVTTDAPVFWVSGNLLSIEETNKLTIEQLLHIIALYEDILLKDYEVISDNYSSNSNRVGRYDISFKLIDVNDKEYFYIKTINVFENMDDDIDEVEKDKIDNTKHVFITVGILLLVGLAVTILQYNKKS